MTIGPISYPIKIQNSDYVNCDGNYKFNTFPASKKEDTDSIFLTSNGNKAQKQVAFGDYEKNIAAQNNLVIKHEEAHRSVSGPQASGSPVYETKTDQDGRLIITGGHQNVIVPEKPDKSAPFAAIDKIIEAAKFTIRGATAPESFDELSDADKQVAARGEQVLSSAEQAKAQRALLQQQFGIEPNQKGDPEKLQQRQAQSGQTNPNQPKQANLGQKLNLIV